MLDLEFLFRVRERQDPDFAVIGKDQLFFHVFRPVRIQRDAPLQTGFFIHLRIADRFLAVNDAAGNVKRKQVLHLHLAGKALADENAVDVHVRAVIGLVGDPDDLADGAVRNDFRLAPGFSVRLASDRLDRSGQVRPDPRSGQCAFAVYDRNAAFGEIGFFLFFARRGHGSLHLDRKFFLIGQDQIGKGVFGFGDRNGFRHGDRRGTGGYGIDLILCGIGKENEFIVIAHRRTVPPDVPAVRIPRIRLAKISLPAFSGYEETSAVDGAGDLLLQLFSGQDHGDLHVFHTGSLYAHIQTLCMNAAAECSRKYGESRC